MSAIDSMPSREFVFGGILLLSNKLQITGDGVMEGVTLKQWFLLIMMNILKEDTGRTVLSVTEVAEFTGTSRQNVKKMLDVLLRKGFVTMTPSTRDLRALDVGLTDRCHEFFARNETVGERFLDKLYGSVSMEDLDTVAKVFRQLFVQLETMATVASDKIVKENER